MQCIRLPTEKNRDAFSCYFGHLTARYSILARLRSALPAGVPYVNGITSTVHGTVLSFFLMAINESVASSLLPTDGRISRPFITELILGAHQITV